MDNYKIYVLSQRLDLALELADKNHIGKAYCSIGNCLRAILQPDKAMECYKRVNKYQIYFTSNVVMHM